MRKELLYLLIFLMSLYGCKLKETPLASDENRERINYIDPFICTANDHGQTDVAAGIPFGMAKPAPDTQPIGHSGYDYKSKKIIGFSNTRFSGVGCKGTGGNLRIIPTVKSLTNKGKPKPLKYSKKSELAQAGYYAVNLKNGVEVELTATRQVAFHQYTFPENRQANLLIDLASSFNGIFNEQHAINDGVIAGKVSGTNVCEKGQYTFYYAIAFNRSPKEIVEVNDLLEVRFPFEKNQKILVRVALSVVDQNTAIQNLKDTDDLEFNDVSLMAEKEWSDLINVVRVETKNDTLKKLFYTHLYHATQTPFMISEDNGDYRGSDGKLYNTSFSYYHGWSVWDTFRTKLPLLSFLYPKHYEDMLWSLRALYKQGKTDWSTDNEPFLTVRTEHTIVILLDAYQKGLLPFPLNDIYEELKEEAERLSFASPDKTLESSYDLWALSEISKILGYTKDAEIYREKAFQYKEVWKDKFLIMDKNADVMHGDGLYEGTLWQYRWFVPFDVEGLQNMMGGKDEFEYQLDYFFDNDLFNIGNQPDIQVPFLYNYTNAPHKTQKLIDKILNTKTKNRYGTHKKRIKPIVKKVFTASPNGFIKEMDDDAGTMSSWFVWSSLGLYPVFPGSTQFALTAPQFDRVTISTPVKPLFIICEGRTPEKKYIKKVTWNGNEINARFIDINLISKGGKLEFELSNVPN